MCSNTGDSLDGGPEERPSRAPQPLDVFSKREEQETNDSANQREGKSPDTTLHLVGPGSDSTWDARHSAGAASHRGSTSEVDSADRLAEPTSTRESAGGPSDKDSSELWVEELIDQADEAMLRFQELGDVEDIDEAINYQSQVLAFTHDGHEEQQWRLDRLGILLWYRFERVGEQEDVNRAIDYQTQAVQLTPDGHPHKPAWLNNLGNSYQSRFKRLGGLSDLDKAIDYQTQAVQATPHGFDDKSTWLSNLGTSYWSRFERLGKLADLDKAIDYQTQAIQLNTDGHAHKSAWLHSLGNSCLSRFQRLGEIADVDQMIDYNTQALRLTPDGHPQKPLFLDSLGIAYQSRFERLGKVTDMDKAIDYQTQAVQLIPDGHPDKPGAVNNLGTSYLYRFDRLGEPADVDKAIDYQTQAVELTPDGHAHKPTWLNNLGISYWSRFERLGDLADVNKAIDCQTESVGLTPDEHADKPSRLDTLGSSYLSRFECLDKLVDVDEAIHCQTQAVRLTPDGHADKPLRLNNLANSYESRFRRLGEVSDLNFAQSSLQQGAQHVITNPQMQMRCARRWANSLSQLAQSPQLAYERCMELVPHLIWLGTSINQRYNFLREISDLANETAAWAISVKEYDLALEWLEEGRSIVWNQILQLRTPFDELSAIDPELAQQLKETASRLESAGLRQVEAASIKPLVEPDTDAHHHRLASKWEQLVHKARGLPGCEHFLRPHKAPALKRAAANGPIVVINAHSTRCDALAVLPNSNSIVHIPLPRLSLTDAAKHRTMMHSLAGSRGDQQRGFKKSNPQPNPEDRLKTILTTLWLDVVKPILDSLGYTWGISMEELPHVTWCTTGALSFLPLHAAGCYDGLQPNAFDLVISSYTPTLSAMLTPSAPVARPDIGVLVVGQSDTWGFPPLPYTIPELAVIKESAKFKEVCFQQLDGANGTVEAVLDALEKHSWVHLACHATQNPTNPTQSAFHLHDGNLTLEAITKCTFTNKGLAFLSACQTAAGDNKLPDEALHLAAGMLMAGYPSVIATMWSIFDEDAPGVAGGVYAELLKEGKMDHGRAAEALHKAVAGLREKVGINEFKRWVPFIHIGV